MASEVARWLGQLGLAQYAQAFDENAITFPILPTLSDDDLKELGVEGIGLSVGVDHRPGHAAHASLDGTVGDGEVFVVGRSAAKQGGEQSEGEQNVSHGLPSTSRNRAYSSWGKTAPTAAGCSMSSICV